MTLKNSPPANSPPTNSKVAIILGYYEGQEFIYEQMQSILQQTYPHVHIHIFDDKSPTPAHEVLGNILGDVLKKQKDRIFIHRNQTNKYFCQNFLDGLKQVGDDYDYYAYADQDDIWYDHKIARAVDALSPCDPDTPHLYGARTTSFQGNGDIMGHSRLFKRPPSFANALVQSIAGGNTMVMNKTARDIVIRSNNNPHIAYHDWWTYQIITGAGGTVLYDGEPCMLYRQHGKNIIGYNRSFRGIIVRIIRGFQGDFKGWNDNNIKALLANKNQLTPANQTTLELFIKGRESGLLKRLYYLKRASVYRQTLFENIQLVTAILLKKV